ncbi:hypothetical protein HPP92_012999 [Vanilla planifolia]|uniref:Geranylgeranyl transferase type-2 subunit alpha n=1 Tax=Vanilla planifolia TaxID=51239 RepID=A0A835QRI3_VANPL|nr:hypothetical protein HPP92_013470 [Vanilla planifolia]KAG0478280.1 hypothetical protein HPP92_012999 [Vanilla planifolia]
MALRRNPKSYGAWYHRKWVLSQGLLEVDFDREFYLLDQLLKVDAQLSWMELPFVAKMKDVSEVEELKFTMDMIDSNFSNYSAWHNRRTLWFFPFNRVNASEDHTLKSSKWNLETISYEIDLFKELEENCKFVKLTLARLFLAQDAMMSYKTCSLIHSRDVLRLFDDLIRLDPMHAGYYEDERSIVVVNQVTSDEQSLMSQNSHSSNYFSSKLPLNGCIQLTNLSLTRIGSVDRLLWVQVLDLSHNKLHSLAGIEALQLLTCLNLRNNQINSLTALEPLKLLSFLRVLDLSFNKIGAHPVDTTKVSMPFSFVTLHFGAKNVLKIILRPT